MSKADVLMTLLPPLYENVLEMQLLTETEGVELDKLTIGLESVLDQFYPESATWALERYERDLQIPTNQAKPDDQRRSVIISKMRGSGKVSGSMLKNVAQAYESGGIEVSVSPEEYLIRIRFIDTWGLPPNLDDLKAAIEDIKPAHMTVEYRLRYLTIAEVESMTLEEKVEETTAQVSNIQVRLDTEKRRSVTLEPGLQVVHAERASAFKLKGLKARTLVNLLGRDGGGETLSGWLTTIQTSLALDTTTKHSKASSIKVMATGSAPANEHYVDHAALNVKVGSYYVLAAMAKPQNVKTKGQLMVYGMDEAKPTDFFPESNLATDMEKFTPITLKFNPKTVTQAMIRLRVLNDNSDHIYIQEGQVINFDSLRLYEISASDYVALDNMTPDQIAAKYPYVDSVQAVRNPYVIRYGENLLPPFYEWEHTGHNFLETSPYTATGELVSGSIGTDAYAVTYLSVLANQEYTISNPAESTGKIRVSIYDLNTRLQGMFINPGETKTIKTVSRAIKMGVNLSGVTQYTEEFDVNKWTWSTGNKASFAYPIVTLGKVVKPFKIREDSMFALQTNLYADPVTGLNADEVFERSGQYYKMTKWRKIILDESLRYRSIASSSGYKIVGCTLSEPVAAFNSLVVTKYNGNVLTKNGNMSESDNAYFRIADLSDFNLSIANADSGWGDLYTPTADEIKAYFMGWRMYDGEVAPYNGAGVKYWHKLSDGTSTPGEGTNTFPTKEAPNRMPYQLIYQLATPTIEPITSEGQLTFVEGDNQVEVGSGMKVRENVNPVFTSDVHKSYNINNYNLSAKLNSKVKKIMSIYKNDVRDYWDILRFNPESEVYGLELASLPASQYDPSAYYTVTYQVLDHFSPVSINGMIGVNEKSIIEQFINDSSNISRQLSVMESKNNEMELQQYADKNYLRKSSSINENEDLNSFVSEGEFYCHLSSTAETLKNCPVEVAFSLKVSKNGTQYKESIPGVTQTLITFLPVGFTTWQRNLYDTWGAWVQIPSREEFESLKSSVSDGKSAIAAAITGKGVVASGSDTHTQLATKVSQVITGKRVLSGTIKNMTYNNGSSFGGEYRLTSSPYVSTGFRPSKIILKITLYYFTSYVWEFTYSYIDGQNWGHSRGSNASEFRASISPGASGFTIINAPTTSFFGDNSNTTLYADISWYATE